MIAFLHIPKTGGTSFSNALRDMVSSGTCQLLSDSDLKQNLAFNGECGLVMGHFTWHGIARYSVGAQIITMLRHPVARAISQYQSWHDSPMDPNWESHLKRNRDAAEALNFARSVRIEEYFASEWEPITRQFTNFQAYVLSGRHIPSTPFKIYLFAVYCRNDQYMSQTTAWTEATGPDDPRVAQMFAVLFQVLFTDQPVHRWRRGPFGFGMMR